MSIRFEQKTVAAMIRLYCRAQHRTRVLCPDCTELLTYAHARLAHCRFGEAKPTCLTCPVHCYRADMRERVQDVMRFAGPRMVIRHPILALGHLMQAKIRRGKSAR